MSIDFKSLKEKAEKVWPLIMKGALSVGAIVLLGKLNDELDKYGVHIGLTPDGGLNLKTDGHGKSTNQERREVEERSRRLYNSNSIMFHPSSVQEKSIIELMHTGLDSYAATTKLQSAKNIYEIASSGNKDTKLVAIQALSGISKSSYSSEVKNYISRAITNLGMLGEEELNRNEVADKDSDNDKDGDQNEK